MLLPLTGVSPRQPDRANAAGGVFDSVGVVRLSMVKESFSDSRTSVTNWKSGQAPRVLAMGPRRVHFSIAHIRLTPFSCGFAYALGDRGSSLSAKHTTAIVLPTLGMGGNLGHPRERCARGCFRSHFRLRPLSSMRIFFSSRESLPSGRGKTEGSALGRAPRAYSFQRAPAIATLGLLLQRNVPLSQVDAADDAPLANTRLPIDANYPAEDLLRESPSGLRAVGLPFLRRVDALQPNLVLCIVE